MNYWQKTAKYIKENYPTSNLRCFKGKGHCEDSLLNPSVMIEELDRVLGMKQLNNTRLNYLQNSSNDIKVKSNRKPNNK